MKSTQKLLLSLNFALGIFMGAMMVEGGDHTIPLLVAAFICISALVFFLLSRD
jgi:hypothetical protein